MIPLYKSKEYKDPNLGFRRPGNWIREGIIQAVNPDEGLVTIEWLDYPGVRHDIEVSQPAQGWYQMPTVGAVVLVGFDQGYRARILRYLPVGYSRQLADGTLWPIRKGEISINSYIEEPIERTKYPVPVPTGASIYLNNIGDIEIGTAGGETWRMDNDDNQITQSSMNYSVSTEAGILQFGLTKRQLKPDDISETIITTTGKPMPEVANSSALTEFRLRILEEADANPSTDPEVDVNPLIELTLGTKVDNSGNVVKTTFDHAQIDQEIIIQLKTKADQGFEFTVDKKGNLTILCKGAVKFKAGGSVDIDVGSTININAKSTINVNASGIELAGTNPLVLDSFLSAYDTHTHLVPTGTSGAPVIPSLPSHKTTVVKGK